MASSTISDLCPFVRRRDLLPDVNGGVERLKFSRYGPSDLASPDQFWICSHGCRVEVCPHNICPGCYVLNNGDSYFWLVQIDSVVLVHRIDEQLTELS
jgi:hypothetical protein